jgi:SAM-dependent MidA family methyltransferase
MKSRLLHHIGRNGSIPFDNFMEMCLYDPDAGFFASGAVRPGEHGDFVTSPEVSPWFGRFLGRWAIEAASSDDAILVEIGSGSGSLLEPLVDEAGERFPEVFAVEVSEAARVAIAERVPSATVVSSISDLPQGRQAVVIANEVLDNMPSRLVERSADGWVEIKVGESEGALSFVSELADQGLSRWCDAHLGSAPPGHLLAAQHRFLPWVEELTATLATFSACVVDYAGSTAELSERDREATVRSYRSQRSGLDYLSQPGEMDITLDVNADVLAAAAHEAGVEMRSVDQRTFLSDYGALDVLSDLSDAQIEYASAGDVMAQLASRSESVGISALLDNDGLGGFSVFLMSRS